MVTYYNTIQFCMNDLKKKKERWKNSRNIFKTLLCAPKSFSYSRCSIIVIQEKNTHAFEIELWVATDYGHPMKLFQNPKLLGLGRQFRQINLGAFGVFSSNISLPISVQWVPCPCFSLINHFSIKTKPLYPNPKYLFGIGISHTS